MDASYIRVKAGARSLAVSFIFVLATFSAPLVLPAFAQHRRAWLLFTVVLAAVSSVVALVFKWLDARTYAFMTFRATRFPIAMSILRLAAGLLCFAVLLHYAALPSDTVFFILTIPYFLAVWFVFRELKFLFRASKPGTPG